MTKTDYPRNAMMQELFEAQEGRTPLLAESERQQLLVAWNDTARNYGDQALLHRLIEKQVALTPDSVALEFDGKKLTYVELNRRANQLARVLRQKGVRPDVLVGVFAERSFEMVLSLLAVLKAGGAYVPLDPSYPAERLTHMIEDARTPLVLAQPHLANQLPKSVKEVHLLDATWKSYGDVSGDDLDDNSTPENLAYVIFTSGSTGRPKGAMNEHRGICNRLLWMQEEYGLTDKDRVLQKTPYSFDVSVWEFFWPLLAGARLVIARPEGHRDSPYLVELIRDSGITTLHFVPSMLRLFLEEEGLKALTSLRRVFCSGEALPHELQERFFARLPNVELHNLYGPTEAAVDVTYWACRRGDERLTVPIGRPVANTQIYVLDTRMEPVPVGVAGELHIGGVQVGRGYVGRDDLTVERFVPDTFSSTPGAHLYKTGDLARYLPDGAIEYLGRIDHQVKMRGQRIELGEIEATLDQHTDVAQSVVIMREDKPGDQHLVAYLVPRRADLSAKELKEHLSKQLPSYMVPSTFVFLEVLPLTSSGKIDRNALPAPKRSRPDLARGYIAPRTEAEKQLAALWCELLQLDQIGIDDSFFDLGGTSLAVIRMVSLYHSRYGREISQVKVFQYPTIARLCSALEDSDADSSFLKDVQRRTEQQRSRDSTRDPSLDAVAIVGMVGRFPGADNLDQLWRNLCNNVESISFFTPEELGPGIDEQLKNDPDYVRARGIIDGAELFDAAFFGIGTLEAKVMDPQQRVFLELAQQALENAGYDPDRYKGLISVFAGIGDNHYYTTNLLTHPDLMAMAGKLAVEAGNQKDYIALRTAYLLDLRGPAVSLNTGCSTTLLAVDLAFRALLDFECDMALAGGIDISVPQKSGFLFQEGGTFAKDGHCRPFDADATGTMFCDGAGIVVLKRLHDALADGDTIYAVLLGSGKNNNGARPASFLAPSVDGQADAIAMAQARADVPVETIRYIEAHGTGTPVGDPIEFEALSKVFQSKTDKKQYCYVGSLKGNIGHPTNAAGVAGLIKAAMVLHNEQIPATLHFKKPNPKIDLKNSPFLIADRLIPFPRSEEPRRAAVSAFGFGGTNVHTILEEAPLKMPGSATRPVQLLLLSARTSTALDTYAVSLAADLENAPEAQFADAAYTLQKGRMQMVQRRFVVAADTKEAVQLLQQPNPLRCGSKRCERRDPPVVFMFGGQGTQYVNMGLNLYQDEPLFRAVVDDCCDLLKPFLGRDLRDILYPRSDDEETARISLQDTFYTQPSIFVIEYALARFWLSLGVRPAIMIGHSIGEFVAATLAGVWDLEDALRIIALRGQLMQELPRGSMLAVNNKAEIVETALPPSVQIASINGPSLCVVAGPEADIAALKETLERQNIVCRHLHTSHAFHSAMMDPMIEPLRTAVAKVKLHAPTQPFVSTVTGNLITAEEATDPGYWAHHARATVQFSKAVRWLVEHQYDLFLECGPRATLSSLARQHFTPDRSGTAIPTFSDTHENNAEWTAMLFALGSLWQNGTTIDWDAFYAHEDRRRIPLPTYPFERQRYWVDPAVVDPAAASRPLQATSLRSESITVALPAAPPVSSLRAAQAVSPDSRKDRLTASLIAILHTVSGREPSQISTSATFLEQGFDSLSLTQVAFACNKEFGIKITFGQFMNQLPNIDMVAAHLDKTLAPDLFSDRQPVEPIAPLIGSFDQAKNVHLPDAVQTDETNATLQTTAGQKEIWFASQLGDNLSRAYNVLVSIRLYGSLNPGILQASLQYLVDTNDSLRITISANGEQQFIHPKRPQELPLIDLSAMEAKEQESRLQVLTDQNSGTLFDLVNGPLMKAQLIRLKDEDHALHLVFHHVVIDGWSAHVVAMELGRIYSTKTGSISDDPLPTMQYRDYVKWYYDPETINSRYEAREYWLKSFADLPASVELPTNMQRPFQRSHRAGNANISINRELYGRLKQFSAKSDCTIFHFLLATFIAWLHHVTNQDNIVVGVPFAGQLASNLQDIADCERLVGHCSNVVPIRSEVHGAATIADFLRDVKRKVFDAKEHEGVTYGELVEKLNPPRIPGRLPLVSVTLNLNDEPDIHWHQMKADLESPPPAYVFRELEINVWECPNGLRIACYYADELFDHETVKGWLYQWKTLMESAADTPAGMIDQLLDALPLPPNAKIDSKTLPKPQAADQTSSSHEYQEPRNDLEISMVTAWEKVLRVQRVGITDNFFELGGHSFNMMTLALEMKQTTGIDISLAEIYSFPTINSLVTRLHAEGRSSTSVVVPLQPDGDEPPIYCVVGINIYREFAQSVDKSQPVFGVYVEEEQAIINEIAKGGRPTISIEKLADAYFNAILRSRPHGPYRLAGVSFGGILAMELASRLRAHGEQVDLVILFDTILPLGMRRNWLKWFYSTVDVMTGRRESATLRKIYFWFRDRFVKQPLNNAQNVRETYVDDLFVARKEAALFSASKDWKGKELIVDYPVLLFYASDHSAYGNHIEFDEDYGWRHYVGDRLSIVKVAGDHLGILKLPTASELGRKTRQFLGVTPR